MNLNEEKLNIKTKTKISFNTIQKSENKEYIFRACEAL